jgi:hypothetical protein
VKRFRIQGKGHNASKQLKKESPRSVGWGFLSPKSLSAYRQKSSMKFIACLGTLGTLPAAQLAAQSCYFNICTWLMRNILPAKRAKFSCKSSVLPIEPDWRTV